MSLSCGCTLEGPRARLGDGACVAVPRIELDLEAYETPQLTRAITAAVGLTGVEPALAGTQPTVLPVHYRPRSAARIRTSTSRFRAWRPTVSLPRSCDGGTRTPIARVTTGRAAITPHRSRQWRSRTPIPGFGIRCLTVRLNHLNGALLRMRCAHTAQEYIVPLNR